MPQTVYTQDEQKKMLADYMLISPDYIHLIKHNSHVRYVTFSGGFRPGGFVVKNPIIIQQEDDDLKCLKLKNGFVPTAPGYLEWIVAYKNIKEIYVKVDAALMTLQTNIEVALRALYHGRVG